MAATPTNRHSAPGASSGGGEGPPQGDAGGHDELALALAGRPILALVGPTASGKSELALRLAEREGLELISLDAMQVYRGMDVGTAKPTAAERARVPHHMLDLVEPAEVFHVERYLASLVPLVAHLVAEERRFLFVGGTGFYLMALLHGLFDGPPRNEALRAELDRRYVEEGPEALFAELERVDPESAARLHPNDRRRVVRALEVFRDSGRPLSEQQREWGRPGEPGEGGAREREGGVPPRPHRILGLALEPSTLDERIRARATAMLDAGWVEEAARIRASGGFSETSSKALGYAEVLALHDGELTRAEALDRIALRTRQFARRQRTWYRRFAIDWIGENERGRALERALEWLSLDRDRAGE